MRYPCIFILMLLLMACSNTERAVEDDLDDLSEDYMEETLPGNISLENLRTTLSDSYSTRSNQVPESFSRVKTESKVEFNPQEGYRIQIYSGQSVDMADTVASRFRTWADTTIANYQPQSYTFFRTPYYRVHVGDFHDRDMAILFSNIVKRVFSDAWVVHDRVEPENVPADTIRIDVE